MINDNFKRNLLIAAFCAASFSLPLSEWLLSVFTIILVMLWIWDGGITRLHLLLKEKRTVLIFLSIWIVYLIWMINTSDLNAGLRALRIKLPLLVFPLVIGLSDPLNKKDLKIVMSFFIAGVVVSSVFGTITGISRVMSGTEDSRELSPFISHIRLALMSVFAIACSGWYFFDSHRKRGLNLLFPAAAFWLIIYLFLLLSLTGILLLMLIIALTLLILAFQKGSVTLRISSVILLTVLTAFPILYVLREVKSYYKPGNSYELPLVKFTKGGNPYWHDPARKDIENGNEVWIYICEPELKKQWNIKSSIPYDSLDKKGQTLRFTLIRYMASAGLTKDSAGFSKLSESDILNIEHGMTNCYFAQWAPLKSKLYEIIWQLDFYRNGGNPTGHSVTQRIEFLKTGWHVFLRIPLFGTGPGDMTKEFRTQYETDGSKLDQKQTFLSHNQFLSFLVSFGITGFIIICLSLFYPVIKCGKLKNYLPAVFLLIIFLSMLWEDTLETHTGVSFFAYFYSLFIFGSPDDE